MPRIGGFTVQKPLHTLRKEMGRILTEKYGIYAASKRFRHADLSVTVRRYTDDQRLLPTGLEGILAKQWIRGRKGGKGGYFEGLSGGWRNRLESDVMWKRGEFLVTDALL